MEDKLTYRDFVANIFTGVLFNIFLLGVLWEKLPLQWQEYKLHNEVILSLIAIPVLYLEGHFILAIDRFFFVEIPKYYFICAVLFSRKTKNQVQSQEQEPVHYRIEAYKKRIDWYKKLYKFPDEDEMKRYNIWKILINKILFFIFLSPRIYGQRVIREDKDGSLVKSIDAKKKKRSSRYYVKSDFFRGVCCAAIITGIIAACLYNWIAVGILAGVVVLSWMRARFYSLQYVKDRYEKKQTNKNKQTK